MNRDAYSETISNTIDKAQISNAEQGISNFEQKISSNEIQGRYPSVADFRLVSAKAEAAAGQAAPRYEKGIDG